MDRRITASVGQGGANRNADVTTVQQLLNTAHPTWGGPTPNKLTVDSWIGPKTIGAIRQFQTHHFATIFAADGRVDPGRRTIKRLNEVASSREVPRGSFHVRARGIHPLIAQPTNMTCWATATTMLMSAHDNMSYTIQAAMDEADHNPGGTPPGRYRTMFDTNQGLPPAELQTFANACGMTVGPMASFPVDVWANMIRRHGAIGVGVRMPFLHIRVNIEMFGDGTSFGTKVVIHDPSGGRRYEEPFRTFVERYEAAAGVNNPQIFHY